MALSVRELLLCETRDAASAPTWSSRRARGNHLSECANSRPKKFASSGRRVHARGVGCESSTSNVDDYSMITREEEGLPARARSALEYCWPRCDLDSKNNICLIFYKYFNFFTLLNSCFVSFEIIYMYAACIWSVRERYVKVRYTSKYLFRK